MNPEIKEELKAKEQEEKVMPPLPEQLKNLQDAKTEFIEYLEFIDEVPTKSEGDEFVLYDVYCVVNKVTPSGHLDVTIYKLEGTKEKPEAGKFMAKQRLTPEGLQQTKEYIKLKIYGIDLSIKEIEEELAELEDGETTE